MKNYVVGLLSTFDNVVNLFKVTAENEYEAVRRAFLEYATARGDAYAIEFHSSDDYPKDLDELCSVYEETPFSLVEVGSF